MPTSLPKPRRRNCHVSMTACHPPQQLGEPVFHQVEPERAGEGTGQLEARGQPSEAGYCPGVNADGFEVLGPRTGVEGTKRRPFDGCHARAKGALPVGPFSVGQPLRVVANIPPSSSPCTRHCVVAAAGTGRDTPPAPRWRVSDVSERMRASGVWAAEAAGGRGARSAAAPWWLGAGQPASEGPFQRGAFADLGGEGADLIGMRVALGEVPQRVAHLVEQLGVTQGSFSSDVSS